MKKMVKKYYRTFGFNAGNKFDNREKSKNVNIFVQNLHDSYLSFENIFDLIHWHGCPSGKNISVFIQI